MVLQVDSVKVSMVLDQCYVVLLYALHKVSWEQCDVL